jgi:Domain of unknown function (DUF4129)
MDYGWGVRSKSTPLQGFWYNSFHMIRKFFDHKLGGMLLAGLAVILLVLLAAGLQNVHFQPGRPLAQGASATIRLSFGQIIAAIADIPIWEHLVFWALVLILVVSATFLLSPELRKRIILFFLRFALFALAVIYLLKNSRLSSILVQPGETAAPGASLTPGVESSPAVFTPPHVSSSLLYLISLGVVILLALAAFVVGRWWFRKQRLRKGSPPLESLVEIARSSLVDISAGKAWEDVIVKCYLRMNEVVETKHGVQRRPDLTPSEFAGRLEAAGLPGEAVRRLTRLFEAARYGAKLASRQEMVEAVSCLSMILRACGVNE